MNSSVINIKGIHADVINIQGEHSTDTAQLLVIKDEFGNEVNIYIVNGRIERKS